MVMRTRDRMIDAAVQLLQQRGLSGMSFTDVIEASGAARGAIYHHFPGGKDELAAEAARRHGRAVRGYFNALPEGSPREVVEAFLVSIRPVLQRSADGSGCAVAAVAGELGEVATTAFDSWTDELATKLGRAGMSIEQARDLAALLITLLEGGHITCRAAATIEPFDRAARILLQLVS